MLEKKSIFEAIRGEKTTINKATTKTNFFKSKNRLFTFLIVLMMTGVPQASAISGHHEQ